MSKCIANYLPQTVKKCQHPTNILSFTDYYIGSYVRHVNGNQLAFYAALRSALARGAGVVSTRITSVRVSNILIPKNFRCHMSLNGFAVHTLKKKTLSQSKPSFMQSILRKGWGMEVYINGSGHMTKMAAHAINSKSI